MQLPIYLPFTAYFSLNTQYSWLQILRVGEELNEVTCVQTIESKLEDLVTEIVQIEKKSESVEILRKKKSWLEFDNQNELVKSSNNASKVLKDELANSQERLRSLENKISSSSLETPLGKV